jgi:hypothetical protein
MDRIKANSVLRNKSDIAAIELVTVEQFQAYAEG